MVVDDSDREAVLGERLEGADHRPQHLLPRARGSWRRGRCGRARESGPPPSAAVGPPPAAVTRHARARTPPRSASSGVLPGAGAPRPSRLCSSTSMLAMQPNVSRLAAAARAWYEVRDARDPDVRWAARRPSRAAPSSRRPGVRVPPARPDLGLSSNTRLLSAGLTASRYSFFDESATRASRVVISRSVRAGIVVVLTTNTTSGCSVCTGRASRRTCPRSSSP